MDNTSILWEDADLTEHETNCSNNSVAVLNVIITDTNLNSTQPQCKSIGREKKGRICGIYKITNNINGKSYFGQSQNIMLRFRRHQIDLINNKHQNIHLQRAWNKYGKENFNFTIHCKCLIEHLDIEEQKCLDLVKSSPKSYYNMGLDVNSPRRGLKFSEESRKKMSNSAKQKFVKFPSLKEKIYTKERNQKIRISKQGSKNYNFGKKLESEETKQKLRAATTGHNNPFFDHNIYTFSHQSHGVIKSTQYDLYTKYNLHKSHVGHIIKGTRKSHHGWKIIYE